MLMNKFSPPKPPFPKPSLPKPSFPKPPDFKPPVFGPRISKPTLTPPLDFRTKPPKPQTWSTHFDKQSRVSSRFANASMTLPKWLPKPSIASWFGFGKPVHTIDSSRATRGIDAAISVQQHIVAHQNNVKKTLERTLAALKQPKFATTFPTARGSLELVNRRLAEAMTNSKAVRAAANASSARLKRDKASLGHSRTWKPASGPLLEKQGELHSAQASLLTRVGKALSRLFKSPSQTTGRKAPAVVRAGSDASRATGHPAAPRKGGREVAVSKGGGRGNATRAREQQRGAQARQDARARRSTADDPFALQPVRHMSDVGARDHYLAGQRRYEADDFSGARSNFESALYSTGPAQRPALLYNIAVTHLRQGHADRVEEIYYELVRDGHTELAARLEQLRTGDPSAGSAASRPPVVGLSALARRLFQAGQRRYDAGDFAGARGDWLAALDLAEPAAQARLRFDIGLTHLRQGHTTRVEEIAVDLIRDGHADLARGLQALRDEAARGADVIRGPIVGPDPQARRLFVAGQRRYDAGDYAGARQAWNTALDMADRAHRPALQYNIGLTHMRQGHSRRAEEIAADLIRDGHTDLAGRLRPPAAAPPTASPAAGVARRPGVGRPAGAMDRRPASRPAASRSGDASEPELFVSGPSGAPRLAPVRIEDTTYVGATSTFVIRFNQELSPDQARQYLWPRGTPTGAGFVAPGADPMAPASGSSAIYHAQIRASGWQGLRPSVHRRLDALAPGTGSVLVRRLAHVDAAVRDRILAFERHATLSRPLAEAWPPADPRYVYYFDGSDVEVFGFEPPSPDAPRLARDTFEQFRRDMVFLVTRRGMRVRDAWSFLVRTYREELVTVVAAFATVLAGAQGSGQAPGRGVAPRPRAPRARRTMDDIGNAPTLPTGTARRRPGRTQTEATRTADEGTRAAPAAFEDVQRALNEHPDKVSLNVTPAQGSPANATHQHRWELAGGQGPAPPYFRAGDQYHVDHQRGPSEQVAEVQAALHQRLRPGRRPAAPASWRDVQDRLGPDPHAVYTSDSPASHQAAWEAAGQAGSAPPIFTFGEDQIRVSMDSLSRPQRAELRSLLR
jgi:tetratricopeptide (TPR) repeat protein